MRRSFSDILLQSLRCASESQKLLTPLVHDSEHSAKIRVRWISIRRIEFRAVTGVPVKSSVVLTVRRQLILVTDEPYVAGRTEDVISNDL